MKKIVLLLLSLFVTGIVCSQSLSDTKRYVFVHMLGTYYQDLLNQIEEDERNGVGKLLEHVYDSQEDINLISYYDAVYDTYFAFAYSSGFEDPNLRNRIIRQREVAPIVQFNNYIGGLNESPLFRSRETWVWFDYSKTFTVKYDLYVNSKEGLLILDTFYYFR